MELYNILVQHKKTKQIKRFKNIKDANLFIKYNNVHNFKELNCWKEAKDFSVIVYKITSKIPSSEIYGITSQIKRAAVSIPSNIAEGAGRNTNKDFSRFIAIALGSTFELETLFIIASELNFIDTKDIEELNLRLNKIQKMLVNFQKHLNNEK